MSTTNKKAKKKTKKQKRCKERKKKRRKHNRKEIVAGCHLKAKIYIHASSRMVTLHFWYVYNTDHHYQQYTGLYL